MKHKFLFGTALFLVFSSVYAEDPYTEKVKVQTLVSATQDVAGRKIEYPVGGDPELLELLVEIPVGLSTGWHVHQNPCIAHVLEGLITVEDENGVKRTFKAGDSFAEVVKLKHCGTNIGTTPVRILLFVAGQKGAPVSIK